MITKKDAYALFDTDVISEIMEGAVKNSAVLQLFRRLPNMTSNKTKMRVLDSLPMAYWVDADTDNGRKKLTNMAWANKYITAEELAVIVPIKEDVLDDADYDIVGNQLAAFNILLCLETNGSAVFHRGAEYIAS